MPLSPPGPGSVAVGVEKRRTEHRRDAELFDLVAKLQSRPAIEVTRVRGILTGRPKVQEDSAHPSIRFIGDGLGGAIDRLV
jgi:hypothetical protein